MKSAMNSFYMNHLKYKTRTNVQQTQSYVNCQSMTTSTDVHKLPKNLEVTAKFSETGGWHAASSILSTHKYLV